MVCDSHCKDRVLECLSRFHVVGNGSQSGDTPCPAHFTCACQLVRCVYSISRVCSPVRRSLANGHSGLHWVSCSFHRQTKRARPSFVQHSSIHAFRCVGWISVLCSGRSSRFHSSPSKLRRLCCD